MAIVGDEDGGCARIAISPSFPHLLYTVCRSSNVSPKAFGYFFNLVLL